MKKMVKKIQLNRETLRQLDPEQLTGPLGGATATCTSITCYGTCFCGGTTTCTNSTCSRAC
jgi:hypothetical protein